jgi:hypothetical protein
MDESQEQALLDEMLNEVNYLKSKVASLESGYAQIQGQLRDTQMAMVRHTKELTRALTDLLLRQRRDPEFAGEAEAVPSPDVDSLSS